MKVMYKEAADINRQILGVNGVSVTTITRNNLGLCNYCHLYVVLLPTPRSTRSRLIARASRISRISPFTDIANFKKSGRQPESLICNHLWGRTPCVCHPDTMSMVPLMACYRFISFHLRLLKMHFFQCERTSLSFRLNCFTELFHFPLSPLWQFFCPQSLAC